MPFVPRHETRLACFPAGLTKAKSLRVLRMSHTSLGPVGASALAPLVRARNGRLAIAVEGNDRLGPNQVALLSGSRK